MIFFIIAIEKVFFNWRETAIFYIDECDYFTFAVWS